MSEIWKPIDEFEDYSISNTGRVRNDKKDSILKGGLNNKGYRQVTIYRVTRRIHRLVAQTFIPNPDNKEQVNHIDGDKLNNLDNNLEWVSEKENTKHAFESGLYDNYIKSLSHSVIGTHIETGETISFKSMAEAQRNGFYSGGISLCVNGKATSHKGYTWKRN